MKSFFFLSFIIAVTNAAINPMIKFQLPLLQNVYTECQKANGVLYFGGFFNYVCLTSSTNVIDFSDTTDIVGTNASPSNVSYSNQPKEGYYNFQYENTYFNYKWPICTKDDPEYDHAKCMEAASKLTTIENPINVDLIYEAVSCLFEQVNADYSAAALFYYNKNDTFELYDFICELEIFDIGYCRVDDNMIKMKKLSEEDHQICSKAKVNKVQNPKAKDFQPIFVTINPTITTIKNEEPIPTPPNPDPEKPIPTPPYPEEPIPTPSYPDEPVIEIPSVSETETNMMINTITILTSTTATSIPTPPIPCKPVIVTKKIKETITEKEIITVTVTEESNPTTNPEIQCADKWAQCGGIDYKGPTCCQSGSTCHQFNKYYSHCI